MKPVVREISKNNKSYFEKKLGKKESKDTVHPWLWQVPFNYNQFQGKPTKRNEAQSTFETLRQFSVHYPIARACIDYRKSQIQQLKWDVVGDNLSGSVQKTLTEFFKKPTGSNSTFRLFIDKVLEDLYVFDAVAVYKQKSRGGDLLQLIPIDSSTIQLLVTEWGGTPEPPSLAYRQLIRGQEITSLTTDELYYGMLNPRTNSPYGLAPLESLLITIDAALKASLYNKSWFDEGNIPEGFVELPEEIANTPEQVKEWMTYFDSMVAGDLGAMRKLFPIPGGANYTPTKKPNDMAFEKFQEWMMLNTTAVFGVPPEEIGFTRTVNKSTAESQRETALDRGLKPMVLFMEEMFTKFIQDDMGIDAEFKFTGVDEVDTEEELMRLRTDLEYGITTVDEVLRSRGVPDNELPEVGRYMRGDLVFVDDKIAEQLRGMTTQQIENMKADLINWQRKALNDVKRGRQEFRSFLSEAIPDDTIEAIEDELAVTKRDHASVMQVFSKYLHV